MRNFQRDGLRQMEVPKGRVAYEPNTLAPESPRECPMHGFRTLPEPENANKERKRSETFADHYSQARQFYRSMTGTEQTHIASALTFELSKVEIKPIQQKMLGHLVLIDRGLHDTVADALGMIGQAEAIVPAISPRDLPESPSLSLIRKDPKLLKGRKAGILITDGFDAELLASLRAALEKAGAKVDLIAPKIGGAMGTDGITLEPDHTIPGGPSVFFDTVVLLPSTAGCERLLTEAVAVNWVRDAFAHLKVIGFVPEAQALLEIEDQFPAEEGEWILFGGWHRRRGRLAGSGWSSISRCAEQGQRREIDKWS